MPQGCEQKKTSVVGGESGGWGAEVGDEAQEGGPIGEKHFCFQSFLSATGTEAVSTLSELVLPGVAGSWDNTTQASLPCAEWLSHFLGKLIVYLLS